jgi:hypothetical protein
MKKTALILLLLLTASFSQTAFAAEFLGGEEISLPDNIADDVYAGGGMINIDKDIEGDLYVGGGQITINGNIKGDLVAAGGQITLNGKVEDDVRISGGSLVVNGNIGDDLVAACGQLNISPNSIIGGSLVLGTGYANIMGVINEDILGGGGKIVLGGTVYRDVKIEVGENISLTKDARINGNLIYTSLTEANLDETQVGGFIEYNKQKVEEQDVGGRLQDFFTRWNLIFQLMNYLSLILIALVVVLLVPAGVVGINKISKAHPWKSLGVGFVVLICSIAACIILLVTVIGMPLAGILFGMLLISWCVAKVYAAGLIGSLLINPKKLSKPKLFGIIALGAFVLAVVEIVPFIGGLVVFLAVLLTFGALVMYKKDLYEKLNLRKLD